jgi:hypothetical protein
MVPVLPTAPPKPPRPRCRSREAGSLMDAWEGAAKLGEGRRTCDQDSAPLNAASRPTGVPVERLISRRY